MITLEQDYELRELNHNKMIVEFWLRDINDKLYNMLKCRYGDNMTWTEISLKLHYSETTLHIWKNEFKRSVGHYVDL